MSSKHLKEELKGLPEYCRLIPVKGKVPAETDWRNSTYNQEEICKKIKTGIGIVQGEKGNGVLCLDFDGANSLKNFKDNLGIGLEDLPPTIAWTSGTPNRHQRAFIVPESEWSRLDSHNSISEVEIKWTGQSVIVGLHPSGRTYKFLKGCSPRDLPIAEAPEILIAAIEKYGADKKTSIKRSKEELIYDSSRVEKYLSEYLQPANEFSDYPTWLKVGMALHHLSQEHGKEWMHYGDWIEWSSWMNNFDEDECEKKWISFGKSANKVTFATIVALAKKHPKFQPSKAPEESNVVITDKPPKASVDFLEAAKNAVEIIEKGWEKIATLPRASQRTAALEKLKDDAGLSTKAFGNVVEDLIAESNTDDIKYSTFEDLMNAKDLKSEPLVERLLPKGNLVILAAQGGTGKSSFCYEIAEAVSNGDKLFGQLPTSLGKVKVIQCDESTTDAVVKFETMTLKPNNDNLSLKWSFKPSMIPDLEKEFIEEETDLCIMDSLVKIFGGGNDLNTPEVGLYMYQLNQIASRTNTTVLIPHHLKKEQNQSKKNKKDDPEVFRSEVTQDDLYGNVFIFNGASDVWGFWIAGKEMGKKIYRLKNLKNRSMTAPSDHLYQLKGDEETWRYTLGVNKDGDIDDAQTIEKAVVIFLENNIGQKFSKSDLYEKISKIRGILNSKESLGQVVGRLYRDRAKTGIDRCLSPESTGGRRPYLYFKR